MPFDAIPNPGIDTDPVVRLLISGYRRIENPDAWGQAFLSRRFGTKVKYCAVGAVVAGSPDYVPVWTCSGLVITPLETSAIMILDCAAETHGYATIMHANDSCQATHTEILEIYREAIDIARLKARYW